VTDPPDSSEPLLYALLDLSFAVADRTNALIADVLAELELTQALANALWHLDPRTPAPAMRQLAAKLRCDPSTVTFLADRLQNKGLLTRQIDPDNRRTKILVLTPAGRSTRHRLVHAMATHSPIARLTTPEQRNLHELLTKAVGVHTLTDRPAL